MCEFIVLKDIGDTKGTIFWERLFNACLGKDAAYNYAQRRNLSFLSCSYRQKGGSHSHNHMKSYSKECFSAKTWESHIML